MKKIERITLFCASSPALDPVFFSQASEFGSILARNNIAMNYGGGAVGLMGAVADSCMAGGGSVRGYIPRFMVEMNWAHKEVEDMMVVETMAERKSLIIENIDAIVALPGGVGTMDELMEVITLKQLGQFLKPIIILNTAGFYDEVFLFLDKLVGEKFMRDEHKSLWTVVKNPEDILPAIEEAEEWDASAIKYAAVERN